jgi:hypothetical protein
MSCSVVALPVALSHLLVLMDANAVNDYQQRKTEQEMETRALQAQDDYNKDFQYIKVDDIVEKEFETAYMDKDILIKTLEEHGVIDIQEEYDGKITGIVDSFNLTFEKPSSEKPYNLKISCREQDCAEEKLNDLNSEYALNVQEEAYLKLIERLKENNMHVEEEVVEDDNTIVLTINLE